MRSIVRERAAAAPKQAIETDAVAPADPVGEASGQLTRLRARMERMQGRRLDAPVLPVHPAFASLLPGRGLRTGSAYSLAPSGALLLALLAQASQAGSWCGVVGMPELGAEAADRLGVDLDRLVLVPDPGSRWLAVTATVAEVLPVVAVRPPGRVGDAEVSRLAARLRDRGTVLLVQGAWPQAEARLDIGEAEWSGVGRGHGYLGGRAVTVSASSRRWPAPRRQRMLLPGPDGRVQALHEPAAVRSLRPGAFDGDPQRSAAGASGAGASGAGASAAGASGAGASAAGTSGAAEHEGRGRPGTRFPEPVRAVS